MKFTIHVKTPLQQKYITSKIFKTEPSVHKYLVISQFRPNVIGQRTLFWGTLAQNLRDGNPKC
jgi:hypothetical protein